MLKKIIFISLILIHFSFSEKEYVKHYFENGKLKEEGWILNTKKTDYWFYYYETGLKKQEGHYSNNQKINWWIYYDKNEKINKKSEYKNNVLNGLTLVYKNGEIALAEKYTKGKKVKSWNSFSEFKKDN